jgi:hypothetical protein
VSHPAVGDVDIDDSISHSLTTLDGYLGRVDSDDLDQVVAALEALGHSVE